jgi:hypothetical protein
MQLQIPIPFYIKYMNFCVCQTVIVRLIAVNLTSN